MKHSIVLGMVIAAGAMSIGVGAQQPQDLSRIIRVERLKDNLYVISGGGGNTVVFITTSGVVVVDAMNPGWGRPILETIKTLTDKPVTTLINTHAHADHVSGNVDFPATVEIIAQRNTKKNMQKMIPDGAAPNQKRPERTIFQANGGRGLATRTFRNRMTLFTGADEVDLYYFGRGHTDGDTWVVFPALGVVDMGDLFPGKTIPLVDAKNGGSAFEIGNTLDKGYKTIKNVDTIITGHGPEMTWTELRQYIAFNREFLEDMRDARRGRKSINEVVETWKIPSRYQEYERPDPPVLKNNVELAYKELTVADGLVPPAWQLPIGYGDYLPGGTSSGGSVPPVSASPAPAPPPPDSNPGDSPPPPN